mmetsp:Transcript_124495/g.398221  ORF Transcript_124495/g.398221 Transcript_124495/m.398221 type:complete len:424 (+) Transcript_124495:315-1586(+)
MPSVKHQCHTVFQRLLHAVQIIHGLPGRPTLLGQRNVALQHAPLDRKLHLELKGLVGVDRETISGAKILGTVAELHNGAAAVVAARRLRVVGGLAVVRAGMVRHLEGVHVHLEEVELRTAVAADAIRVAIMVSAALARHGHQEESHIAPTAWAVGAHVDVQGDGVAHELQHREVRGVRGGVHLRIHEVHLLERSHREHHALHCLLCQDWQFSSDVFGAAAGAAHTTFTVFHDLCALEILLLRLPEPVHIHRAWVAPQKGPSGAIQRLGHAVALEAVRASRPDAVVFLGGGRVLTLVPGKGLRIVLALFGLLLARGPAQARHLGDEHRGLVVPLVQPHHLPSGLLQRHRRAARPRPRRGAQRQGRRDGQQSQCSQGGSRPWRGGAAAAAGPLRSRELLLRLNEQLRSFVRLGCSVVASVSHHGS